MPVKRVLPKDAADLLAQGYKYLDVRSIPEFEAGHATGAYNVPLLNLLPGRGMVPNPAFLDVVSKRFAKDDRIVCGCKSGGRSLRAAEMLTGMGYTSIVDLQTGFDGSPDGKGWRDAGLPIETKADAGKSYAELEK